MLDSPELLPEPLTSGIPAAARDILTLASFLMVPIVAAGWLLDGPGMGFAVLGGSLVGLTNFWLLSLIVVKTTGGEGNGAVLFSRMLSKFALLLGSLAVVIWLFRLEPLGVLLGIGTIFPAILLGALIDVFRDKSRSDGVMN